MTGQTQDPSRTKRLADLFGLRLRPDLHTTFEELATQLSATMRGFVLTAPARPDLTDRRLRPGALGTANEAEWSQPSLGIAATALSFLEPDPAVEWDEEHLTRVWQTLRE